MLLLLLKIFRGYVDFTVRGKFPERFINLTATNGVILWNTAPCKDGLTASMGINDYKKIRKIAHKSKVRLKIIKKHGLPFFISKYKIRFGLVAGAVVGAILIIVLSNFVWSVNVIGANNISKTYIQNIVADNGVYVGAYKNNIDVQKIERNTILKIKDIGWMSINITGNIANIEIKEKYKKPKVNNEDKPCNIVANTDGVITKIKAYKGVPKALVGSGVVKNDVVVSGIVEGKENKISYVHANAEVFADVFSKKNFVINKKCKYVGLTGNSVARKQMKFLWSSFPCSIALTNYKYFVPYTNCESLFVNDTVLPLNITTQNELELNNYNNKINKTVANDIVKNECMLYEFFNKTKSKLVKRKLSVTDNKDNFEFCVDYVFNEDIANCVEFNVTE